MGKSGVMSVLANPQTAHGNDGTDFTQTLSYTCPWINIIVKIMISARRSECNQETEKSFFFQSEIVVIIK
jgi:hypothetical protein